jgi:hypothetical protein
VARLQRQIESLFSFSYWICAAACSSFKGE